VPRRIERSRSASGIHPSSLTAALAAGGAVLAPPALAWAEQAGGARVDASPLSLMLAVALLTLLPFLFVSVTSFAKISVVLGILRHAVGTPQVPSSTVVSGLAIILTLYVMAPVWDEIEEVALPRLRDAGASDLGASQADAIIEAASAAREPIRRFLERNASRRNVELFLRLARRPGRAEADQPTRDALMVLAPAFVITELAEGFLVGFLLFVPFLVVDIVVSNVLMSLGMHMLSPTTISLPLKLLLFVLVDGWNLVCYGLVSGYS
jgi:type III secretion protein R